jgi:hypothetical protein
VRPGVFEFFQVFGGRIAYFTIVFDFYHRNSINLFYEEIRAEFTPLWMFPLFPGIFNSVSPAGRAIAPTPEIFPPPIAAGELIPLSVQETS